MVRAERAAGALPDSLERIGDAEGRAERTYRTIVDGQRAANATGIPRLSAAAETAIGALRAAPDEKARGESWRAVQKDERVAAELGAFRAAVTQRFGGQPGAVSVPSVSPEQQPAVDRVAGLTATLRQGKRASASLAQHQAESKRQGQHRGLRS